MFFNDAINDGTQHIEERGFFVFIKHNYCGYMIVIILRQSSNNL